MTPRPGFTPARVLVVGEALVDVVRRDGEEVAHPGGSPLNVAVGLQRLEVPTTLHSTFGADPHGVAIAQHLEASEVSVTPSTVSDRETSVALASLGADGAATYAFSIDWDPAHLEVADGTFDAVHTGSIGAVLEPGATMVERLLERMRPTTTVSYDPNVRPQLMGSLEEALPRVERLIALADVVKASDEDVSWLYPGAAVADVQARWLALGPALVVVTHGAGGADALAASGAVHVAAPSAVVADTIGAGDSFMAGLLKALSDLKMLGGDRREALRGMRRRDMAFVTRSAIRCAMITVSRPGADPPTQDEVAQTYRDGVIV
ncbi:MAG: carbohydrate kinase [Pseudolysinimonas sp.]